MKCCEGHAVDLIGRMTFLSRVELAGLLGADDRETERVLGALREAGLIEVVRWAAVSGVSVQRFCLTAAGVEELCGIVASREVM